MFVGYTVRNIRGKFVIPLRLFIYLIGSNMWIICHLSFKLRLKILRLKFEIRETGFSEWMRYGAYKVRHVVRDLYVDTGSIRTRNGSTLNVRSSPLSIFINVFINYKKVKGLFLILRIRQQS